MQKSHFTYIAVIILGAVLGLQSPARPLAFPGATPISETAAAVKGGCIDLDYGKLPLYFIQNVGQEDAEALFYARTSGYSLWLSRRGMVFDLKPNSSVPKAYKRDFYSLEFLGAAPDPQVIALDDAEYKVNYFAGRDPADWKTNIPTSRAVLYQGLYPGIDLKIYGREKKIEYDWIVHPCGDVSQIRIVLQGAQETRIDAEENLVVNTVLGEFTHIKPVCYQDIKGVRVPVAGSFQELALHTYGITVADYDNSFDLVIDPVVLVYSTYLGGGNYEYAADIALDSQGAAYIAGTTYSANFPLKDPFDTDIQGQSEAFVTKIDPAGKALVYSTYLGGSLFEEAGDVAVDSAGSAYIVGSTKSLDFPVKNAFQRLLKGESDVFVTKLSPDGGSLVYSSFLGGFEIDHGAGIAVDKKGAVYVTGSTNSSNFPLKKPFQQNPRNSHPTYREGFITKIHSKGKSLVYSSYLGGDRADYPRAVAVNKKGEAFITGRTNSLNFPTVKAAQASFGGYDDAFVCKVHREGRRLLYSTYLGGTDQEYVRGIALDKAGAAYVTGHTYSNNFPDKYPVQGVLVRDEVFSEPDQYVFKLIPKESSKADDMDADCYVTKLSPDGRKFVYSTFIRGNKSDQGISIVVDSEGSAFVTGSTKSKDFPTADSFQKKLKGGSDAFICKLFPSGDGLMFSTYLGGSGDDYGTGIVLDAEGKIYIVGSTKSTDFPLQKPLQKNKRGSKHDLFITKLESK